MTAECKGLKLKLNADKQYVLEACSSEWVFASAR